MKECRVCHQLKPESEFYQYHKRGRLLSKNGNHTKDNVVPACRACNSRKGAKCQELFLMPA